MALRFFDEYLSTRNKKVIGKLSLNRVKFPDYNNIMTVRLQLAMVRDSERWRER